MRYVLPAIVTCTDQTHPGEWSVDPRAEHPVPVPPDDMTPHLTVFTPGKGVYVEHAVPYDPHGSPRSWRWPERG